MYTSLELYRICTEVYVIIREYKVSCLCQMFVFICTTEPETIFF